MRPFRDPAYRFLFWHLSRQAQWSRSTLRNDGAAEAFGLRREGVKGEGRLCKKPFPLACLFPPFLHEQKRGPSGASYHSNKSTVDLPDHLKRYRPAAALLPLFSLHGKEKTPRGDVDFPPLDPTYCIRLTYSRQAQRSRSTLRNGGAVKALRFRGRDS